MKSEDQDQSGVLNSGAYPSPKELPAVKDHNPHPFFSWKWFFFMIFDGISFSIKAFLRNGIGKHAFNLGSIIFAYIWVRFFMADFLPIFKIPHAFRILDNGGTTDEDFYYVYLFCWVVIHFLEQLIKELPLLISFQQPEEVQLNILFWYSNAVLLAGAIHIFIAQKKIWIGERTDTKANGKSTLFQFLEGKKLQKLKISQEFIWTVLEPIVGLAIGSILFFYNQGNLACFLVLSSIVLLFQEKKLANLRYRKKQAPVNAEFEAKMIWDNYKSLEGDSPTKSSIKGSDFGETKFY